MSINTIRNFRSTASGAWSQPSIALSLLATIVAPAALLLVSGREPHSVPVYLLALTGVVFVLAILVGGFMMFFRDDRTAMEVSIRPETRR
jgi:thiosulfate reductase cytochrome b subunit